MTKSDLTELNNLVTATGMTYKLLGSLLDVDERTLARWVSGERAPNHPNAIKKAIQLILLEQQGALTDKAIKDERIGKLERENAALKESYFAAMDALKTTCEQLAMTDPKAMKTYKAAEDTWKKIRGK
jgi:hypothetical protein